MNKYVKFWIAFIGCFLISFIGSFIYYYFSFRPEIIYSLNFKEIDVYSKYKVSDLINTPAEIVDDYYVDTTKVGRKKIKYTFSTGGFKTYEDYFYIDIVDTEAPYVMLGNSYSHIIGNSFNMETSVFMGDNVTKRPNVEIVGDYDLEKVGNYPLIFRVSDESGNVTEKEFTLYVKEKSNSSGNSSSSSSYITFEELQNRIPEGAELMVDVSKWQEDINWQEVYDSGIRYAMLRLGTQNGVDKDSRLDIYFDKNIKEAQAVGIKVGVYYFSYANDIEDAKSQAKWVVDSLKDYELDLPVAFDWECWNLFDDFKLNFYELNMIGDTFLKIVEEAGYDTLLYGSKNYIENIWTYLDYDIWLAHYTKSTTYSGPMKMWQFTNSGRVPGIKGNVDVNFYYVK